MDYQEKSSKLVHFSDPKANLLFRMGHPPPMITSKIICVNQNHVKLHYLDISDQGFHDPFSFCDSSKRQTLQPFFLAKYQMIGANHQKITFQFLVDFVFHPMSKKGKALILV